MNEQEKKFWEDKRRVSITMRKFGGSFVSALGTALMHADKYNTIKLKEAFPEYWKKHLNMYDEKRDGDAV